MTALPSLSSLADALTAAADTASQNPSAIAALTFDDPAVNIDLLSFHSASELLRRTENTSAAPFLFITFIPSASTPSFRLTTPRTGKTLILESNQLFLLASLLRSMP